MSVYKQYLLGCRDVGTVARHAAAAVLLSVPLPVQRGVHDQGARHARSQEAGRRASDECADSHLHVGTLLEHVHNILTTSVTRDTPLLPLLLLYQFTCDTCPRRVGAMKLSAPICTPMEAGLEKPQRAYVEMATDL